MNNAVIYARYSSQGQNEQTIDGQIRICQEYAANMGFNVIKVYADKARSGTNDSRPEFQRMIKDAVSENFQYVIVYMLDRFARNRRDSIMYKEMLKQEHGIKVLSATQQISDDEGGEFYEMFLEWNDEKYSKRLSKRVMIGLDTSTANGTYTGGYLLCGYKLIDTDRKGRKGTIHKVIIDDEQAEIVRYIFSEYAKGTSKKDIASALNAQGKRYNGKPFTLRTFETWLSNRKYTGKFYFGKRLCTNQYPQIIDEITFEKVQERLKENRHLAGANSAIEPYLLTGKAYCAYCHTAMIADSGTSRNGTMHYYYACKKKKRHQCHKSRENKNELEKLVTMQVKDFLSDRENAEQAAQNTISYYQKRTGDDGLKSLESRIANIKTDVEKMTTAFIDAQSSLLRSTIERRMKEQEILLADLEKQKSKILLERGQQFTVADILNYISNLIKGDPDDKNYQKQIIDNLVVNVTVYDDSVATTINVGVDKIKSKLPQPTLNELFDQINRVRTQSAPVHQQSIMNNDQEYADLLKRAHDLGIIAIGGAVINPDILRDAIESTEKIYADPEYQRIADSFPPVTAPQKLTRCTIQPDVSLLRDVVEVLEQHPIDFTVITQEMNRIQQNPER